MNLGKLWEIVRGRLQSMGSQRVRHDLATEQQQQIIDWSLERWEVSIKLLVSQQLNADLLVPKSPLLISHLLPNRWLHWNTTTVAKSASPLQALKLQHVCPSAREMGTRGDSQTYCIRRGLQAGDEQSFVFHFLEVPWVILHKGSSANSLRNAFPTWEFSWGESSLIYLGSFCTLSRAPST